MPKRKAKTNRDQILMEAQEISATKSITHGDFDHQMVVNDQLLAAYFEAKLAVGKQPFDGTGRDAAMALVLNKISRIACGNDEYDHFLDGVNYLAQAGNLAASFPLLETDVPQGESIEPSAQEQVEASLEVLKAGTKDGQEKD